jgi:hypothetical protein
MGMERLFVKDFKNNRVFFLDTSIYRINGCFRLPFNCKKGSLHFLKPFGAAWNRNSFSLEEKLEIIHSHLFGTMQIPSTAILLDQLGISGSKQSQDQGRVAPLLFCLTGSASANPPPRDASVTKSDGAEHQNNRQVGDLVKRAESFLLQVQLCDSCGFLLVDSFRMVAQQWDTLTKSL